MTPLGFGIWDGDNHYYEPRDAFTRYVEPRFRDRAVRVVNTPQGKPQIWIGEREFHFLDDTFASFEKTVRPGSLREFLKSLGSERLVEPESVEIPMDPAFQNRDARLARMDEQGVEAAWMFPSQGVCMEGPMQPDIEASVEILRAFNRWLDDDWGFHYKERIFAAPYLTLSDVDECVAELEWVLDRGARLVIFQYGPVLTPTGYKSPGDECFDPVWARIEEAGIVAGFHGGDSAYSQLGAMWGESGEAEAFRFRLMRSAISATPIADTMAALILHGVPSRFPGVRLLAVETGAEWVEPMLYRLGKVYKQQPKAFDDDPREVFKRNAWVSPFYENDLAELAELIGADHMLMGSDWPHTEGLSEPLAFVDDLIDSGFGQDDIQKICHDNGAALVAPPA